MTASILQQEVSKYIIALYNIYPHHHHRRSHPLLLPLRWDGRSAYSPYYHPNHGWPSRLLHCLPTHTYSDRVYSTYSGDCI